jgi:hypothetical protein
VSGGVGPIAPAKKRKRRMKIRIRKRIKSKIKRKSRIRTFNRMGGVALSVGG